MIETVSASEKNQARFLRVFAFIGALTALSMAITSFLDGYKTLSSFLIIALFVFSSPFVIKKNDQALAVLMLYTLYLIMCYLIFTGGSNGTGPFWLFIVAPVTFFIRGLKKGAIDLAVLAIVVSVLFYYTGKLGYYHYPSYYFSSRIMLSFSVLCCLSALYEYYRNKYSHALIEQLKINTRLAQTDAMTGLYNRGYATQWIKDPQYGEGACFLLIDIDNFKQVNDTYSHQKGDEVLIFIASILKGVCNEKDIVSRWGGEEFLIVIPQGKRERADNVAQAIHKHLAAHTFNDDQKKFNVTLSIGLYQRAANQNIDQCLNIADKRLYRAKSNGKNQTVSADVLS